MIPGTMIKIAETKPVNPFNHLRAVIKLTVATPKIAPSIEKIVACPVANKKISNTTVKAIKKYEARGQSRQSAVKCWYHGIVGSLVIR